MAKISAVQGTVSKTVRVFIQNNSVTTGAGLTGLAFNTGGLTAYYYREGTVGSIPIALQTATLGTWISGGFVVVDGTNMPGTYELGIPNAALAVGSESVVIFLQGAANMAPLPLEIELTATNNQDPVRGGMTALPNANAQSAGGLPTSGAGANQIVLDASGRVTYAPGEMQVKTNVAFNNFSFVMVSSTDHVTPTPGLTVTATRSINGAAFAPCANAAANLASGFYTINLAASDLNGSIINLLFTAPGADSTSITVITQA